MNALEKLKELSQQATPGPWVVGGSYTVRTMRSSLDWIARVRDRHHSHADSEDAANAKLIATLHNALPALIAVVEADIELNRLIAQNDKLLGGSKITQVAIRKKWDERDAALAALEVEA